MYQMCTYISSIVGLVSQRCIGFGRLSDKITGLTLHSISLFLTHLCKRREAQPGPLRSHLRDGGNATLWQSLVFDWLINMIYGSVWTDRDTISYVEKRCCSQLCTRRSVNFRQTGALPRLGCVCGRDPCCRRESIAEGNGYAGLGCVARQQHELGPRRRLLKGFVTAIKKGSY